MSQVRNRLLDALEDSFRAALQSSGSDVPPVALLWTDADGQWLSLLQPLRALKPWVYTLGKYDPAMRTGPAIWLKCIVDRTVPEASAPGETPVLYLPRVRRQDLRAAGECPPELRPLVELQYRGQVWRQPNGHDWTVRAFLASEDGLGLEIAGDRRTEDAMLRNLPLLAGTEANPLRGKRLDADDFDKLAVADPVRDLLLWLNQPEPFEISKKGALWEAFRSVSEGEFGIDPDQNSPNEVAGRLLQADLTLDRVWSRFTEAPQLYPGVAKLLREPAGQTLLTLEPERDPRINEQAEKDLRAELEALIKLPHGPACARVLQLEGKQIHRRDWVWSRLGWSPWAMAMTPLAHLARTAPNPVGGGTLAAVAAAYSDGGWQCDAAAMEALTCFRSGHDAALMARVVRTLYEPWLDRSARHFQSLTAADSAVLKDAVGQTQPEADTCVMFVDGLRFDLAGRLAALLEARSLRVVLTHRLAPNPTVTATAKPVAAPIPDGIRGEDGQDFTPLILVKSGWKPLTAPLLRERLESAGVDVIDANESRFAANSAAGGWTECGSIDSMGHSLQAELVHQLNAEIEKVAGRAESLLHSGWRRVRIVTDHGWLLLPGGLPKVALPNYVTETKWARCAVVKGEPDLSVPVVVWYWNPKVRIASPPGIGCFRAGESYAHGGLSPQECIVPVLEVESGVSASYASIQSIEWRGLRCRIRVQTNDPRTRVDLRMKWKDEKSTIVAGIKEIGTDGEVSLVVPDDAHMGAAAWIVALDANGNVITSQTTSVGEKR
jgi:hypothetical protein